MGRIREPKTRWREEAQKGAEGRGPADWKWLGKWRSSWRQQEGDGHPVDGPCLMHIPGQKHFRVGSPRAFHPVPFKKCPLRATMCWDYAVS